MPNLSIRNLTNRPIELQSVERFEAEKVSTGNLLTNLINSTANTEFHAKGDSRSRDDVNVNIDAFATQRTEIGIADNNEEILRLTFKTEDHRYETDIPCPSRRSATMKKLDDGPHELTVVYIPQDAFVAIYSSARLNSWMGELNNDWPLPVLSIPGTHNSPTCYTALPSVRCQAVGVPEQLENGIRFMDIRVSANPDDDKLALVHSAFPISLTGTKYFSDMLEDVYQFLDRNPSETVLMSIKREGTGKGSDQDASRYLKGMVDRRQDRWFTEPVIPTLGQARGRIVLIRRLNIDDSLRGEHDGRGWGIDAAAWPDNCEDGEVGGGQFRVQDFYEVSESQNIEKKVNFSHGHLERAAEKRFLLPGMPDYRDEDNKNVPPFFVNFLSASNFFNASCWPERIAAKVNPSIVQYLCTTHGEAGRGPSGLPVGTAGAGIVVTDWVGHDGDWDLVRCIVGMNARLQQ